MDNIWRATFFDIGANTYEAFPRYPMVSPDETGGVSVVASNGQLRDVEIHPDSTRSYHWFVSTPISAYNVALNIAPYMEIEDEFRSVSGGTFPVVFYHLPEDSVLALVARDRNMVVPRGATELRPGDHLFVIARDGIRPDVDRALGAA